MAIYEPLRQEDGTFYFSPEQLPELKKKYASEQLYTALLKLYEATREDVAASSDEASSLPPCGTCGGIEFIRTGTCHACAVCGESQGCS